MRLFYLSLLIGCCIFRAAAQEPRLPEGHPPVAPANNSARAAELTERLRPSGAAEPARPVTRKNIIDDYIFNKMEKDGVPHAPLSSDEEFFRRVHIDLTGRVAQDGENLKAKYRNRAPAAVEYEKDLEAFLASNDPDKRDKLIDQLVKTPGYYAKWTYLLTDLFRSSGNRVGNNGKNLFYSWIYDNIQMDRPYSLMVHDMLTTTAASNWFVGPASYLVRSVVIGVKCEETVHEDTSDELAIGTAKHFLGIDLNCVSCHDGRNHLEKINSWLTERKREELWQMAAFFGKTRVLRRVEVATTQDEYSIDEFGEGYDSSATTVVRIPRNGEGPVEPVFLLTGERPDPNKNLRAEYARMLTSHPQFARATVNLLWSEMFGVGIVDPPLDFDLARTDPEKPPAGPWALQPSHPELLNALGEYFREHNYSLAEVLKLITKSSAYQLSSQFPGEWKASYAKYFARKFARRLKAEEIHDALVQATGLYNEVIVRGTDHRARYATEAHGPEDMSGRDPILKDVRFFLESFGQPNREYSERSNEGSITQAILLMNSPFVQHEIQAAPGSYLAGLLEEPISNEEKIARLFKRFLIRNPTAEEMADAERILASTPGKDGWVDLQWLLVNKVEFVHNF